MHFLELRAVFSSGCNPGFHAPALLLYSASQHRGENSFEHDE